MPYLIYFNNKDKIVVTQILGAASLDEHYSARDEALQLCAENNCSRILMDMIALNTSRITTIGYFLFGKTLPHGSMGIYFALVLPSDAKSRSDVKFICTVAINRGSFLDAFENSEEAREWLLSQKKIDLINRWRGLKRL